MEKKKTKMQGLKVHLRQERKEKRKRGLWPAKGEGDICDCVVGNKWVGGGHMWV